MVQANNFQLLYAYDRISRQRVRIHRPVYNAYEIILPDGHITTRQLYDLDLL